MCDFLGEILLNLIKYFINRCRQKEREELDAVKASMVLAKATVTSHSKEKRSRFVIHV